MAKKVVATLTVCEALKELKTLDARIKKNVTNALILTVQTGDRLPVGIKSVDQFKEDAKASLQSIEDLIARRNALKSAIVESNAKTKVVVGGITYTVAGAIERKSSIQYDQSLYKHLGTQLLRVLREIEAANQVVQRNLDSHITTILGKDAKDKGGAEVEEFTNKFLAKNEAKLVDPIGAKAKIDVLEKNIEDFLANVDTALSISNATTSIEV